MRQGIVKKLSNNCFCSWPVSVPFIVLNDTVNNSLGCIASITVNYELEMTWNEALMS